MNPQKFVFDTSFEEKDMASNEPLYSENHLIKHAEMHFQKGFDAMISGDCGKVILSWDS